MAINFATDKLEARLAILLNQALFQVGAPTQAQLDAQIDFLQTYKGIFGGNEILAVQELVRGTLAFPQNANKSIAQIAADTWANVVGRAATAEEVAFLVNAYSPFGADAKTLLVSNIIVQYANTASYIPSLDEFTLEVQAGTADLKKNALLAPTDVKIDNNGVDAVRENADSGELVGTLSAIDPNAVETHTFKLLKIDGVTATGSNAEVFKIVGNQIVVNNADALDFEVKSKHTIDVQATDVTGRSTTKQFTVNVGDVGPEGFKISGTSVDEEQAAGAVVGALSATDDQGNAPYTFEIQPGADANKFKIEGNQLVTAAKLDYEAGDKSFKIDIKVTDKLGESKIQTVTVTVNDVADDGSVQGLKFGQPNIGTTANDLFVGAVKGKENEVFGTYIDGKSGTDKLKLTVTGNYGNGSYGQFFYENNLDAFAYGLVVNGITTVSVEALCVTNLDEHTPAIIDMRLMDGVKDVENLRSSSPVVFSLAQSAVDVKVTHTTTDTAVIYNDDALLGDTKIKLTLEEAGCECDGVDVIFKQVDCGGDGGPKSKSVLEGASIETLTIDSKDGPDGNWISDLIVGKALTTLIITGAGDLSIGEKDGCCDENGYWYPGTESLVYWNPKLATIDGSAATGDLNLLVANHGENYNGTVKTGSGDDNIHLGSALKDGVIGDTNGNGKQDSGEGIKAIDGGAGTDTVTLGDFTDVPLTTKFKLGDWSNSIEWIAFDKPVGGVRPEEGDLLKNADQNAVLDVANLDGITNISIENGFNYDHHVYFAQIPRGTELTVKIDCDIEECCEDPELVGKLDFKPHAADRDCSLDDCSDQYPELPYINCVVDMEFDFGKYDPSLPHTFDIPGSKNAFGADSLERGGGGEDNVVIEFDSNPGHGYSSSESSGSEIAQSSTSDGGYGQSDDAGIQVNLYGDEIDNITFKLNVASKGTFNDVHAAEDLIDLETITIVDNGAGSGVFRFDGDGKAMPDLTTIDASGAGSIDVILTGLRNSGTGDETKVKFDHTGLDITTSKGDDIVGGSDLDDTISTDGGHDQAFGYNGDDVIHLGTGNDYAEGGRGNDELFGEDGYDCLFGDKGNDCIDGGKDGDNMTGGDGCDVFVVDITSSNTKNLDPICDPCDVDVITDFHASKAFDAADADKIVFTGLEDKKLLDGTSVFDENGCLKDQCVGTLNLHADLSQYTFKEAVTLTNTLFGTSPNLSVVSFFFDVDGDGGNDLVVVADTDGEIDPNTGIWADQAVILKDYADTNSYYDDNGNQVVPPLVGCDFAASCDAALNTGH